MAECNVEQGNQQPISSRGQARGLIAVWEETRRRRNRIWFGTDPTPGHSRATMVPQLHEMVSQNAIRVPGPRPYPMGRSLMGIMGPINHPSNYLV